MMQVTNEMIDAAESHVERSNHFGDRASAACAIVAALKAAGVDCDLSALDDDWKKLIEEQTG